jgi:micrococcal nuclease
LSRNSFRDDVFSRRVMGVLLFLQVGAMIGVLMLSSRGHSLLALGISILTLGMFVAALIGLYVRYRNLPIVREKSVLEERVTKFQNTIQTEGNVIVEATKKREELIQAEKHEIETALSNVQDAYIEYGLANAFLKDAPIPGIGPKLKERLGEHGILTAAQVNDEIPELPGFGEAKRQALANWRKSVMAALESTKPTSLREERLEAIRRQYEQLHQQNDLLVRDALESRNLLEFELRSFVPQLERMRPVSFLSYLSRSLASRGMVAASIALLLMLTQLVSSVTAAASTIMALSPVEHVIAAETLMPTPAHFLPTKLAPTQTGPTSVPETAATLPPPPTPTDSTQLAAQPTLPASIEACLPRDTSRETALVTGVVDGDTIDVQIGDQSFRVRYIGIDTPENDEALFGEATAYNQSLILNKTVILVKDQSETDSFGRLLRYVVLDDTFVNYELVKSGFASASAYAPDVACSTAFEVAQGQAQLASLGLWMPTPGAFIAPVTGEETATNCDPSYPGVCIPPAPPDLDCKDVPYKRFTVLPPDPHGFDRDGDGVGCES